MLCSAVSEQFKIDNGSDEDYNNERGNSKDENYIHLSKITF